MRSIILSVLLALVSPALLAQEPAIPPSVAAASAAGAIVLDGSLDNAGGARQDGLISGPEDVSLKLRWTTLW